MKLQEIRRERGFEQAEFAKKIETSAPMMSCFENYKCIPVPEMLKKICEVLECNIEDIYEKKEIFVDSKEFKGQLKVKATTKSIYKLTVELPNSTRNVLTQNNLEKCGYHSLKDFIWHCCKRFERQLSIINKKSTKHSNCSVEDENGLENTLSH